jgi:hypothetical protein
LTKKEGSGLSGEAGKTTGNISEFNDSEYTRGEHPNSLKNLKPFPKGVSGNPLGKPYKYQKLAERLNEIGNEQVLDFCDEPKGYTFREGVLQKVWDRANQGDMKFIQLLAYLGCLDG